MKMIDRLIQFRWTGDWIAKCPGCHKEFRTKKVRKGQVRFCSQCGRDRGVLVYRKEMEEVLEGAAVPTTFLSFHQQELMDLVLAGIND